MRVSKKKFLRCFFTCVGPCWRVQNSMNYEMKEIFTFLLSHGTTSHASNVVAHCDIKRFCLKGWCSFLPYFIYVEHFLYWFHDFYHPWTFCVYLEHFMQFTPRSVDDIISFSNKDAANIALFWHWINVISVIRFLFSGSRKNPEIPGFKNGPGIAITSNIAQEFVKKTCYGKHYSRRLGIRLYSSNFETMTSIFLWETFAVIWNCTFMPTLQWFHRHFQSVHSCKMFGTESWSAVKGSVTAIHHKCYTGCAWGVR